MSRAREMLIPQVLSMIQVTLQERRPSQSTVAKRH